MFFGKLKKENEFLKRLVAVLQSRTYVCDICVFRGTIPQSCEVIGCETCESRGKGTSACCACENSSNFLWDGRDT